MDLDIPVLTVDPPVTDEFCSLARYSGVAILNRVSSFHALNSKATAKKIAYKIGKKYEEINMIVIHLGGGISVSAHEKGKAIDVNNSLDGDGPFSPERAGSLPTRDLVKLCFSGKYTEDEILQMLTGKGGLVSYLGTSNCQEVEEILKVHARNKPLAESVELSVLARRTPGFTGADLENLMNEAALLSARRDKTRIEMPELEEAITRVIAGPEKKSRVMTERERRLVAYHEAGHAVVAQLLPTVDPVHEVSIVPRGRAGGYTMILPKEDRFFMGKSELMDQVTHLLGGRVSEELVLNEISTGAQNDLERATQIARKMVMEFGMSENIGPMTLGHKHEEVFLGRDLAQGRNYSEEVAASIDKEVRNIIEKCYDTAKALLTDNINKLHKVAQALLEQEKLDEEEFLEVFASA